MENPPDLLVPGLTHARRRIGHPSSSSSRRPPSSISGSLGTESQSGSPTGDGGRESPDSQANSNSPSSAGSMRAADADLAPNAEDTDADLGSGDHQHPQTEGRYGVGIVGVANIMFDTSSDKLQDGANRSKIQIIGTSIIGRSAMSKAIKIIHSQYNKPWISWKKVPVDVRDLWWRQFKAKHFWEDRDGPAILDTWNFRCNQHLRSAFYEAKENGTIPKWLDVSIWSEMQKLWDDPAYKELCKVNKRNRASEGRDGTAVYTGGSRSVVDHVIEFERIHEKKMTQEELIKVTYQKKGTKEWSGTRPEISMDRYNLLCSAFLEKHPEGMTQEDAKRLWTEAVGGQYKGRIWGLGSLHRSCPDTLNPAIMSPIEVEKVSQLEKRLKLMEDKQVERENEIHQREVEIRQSEAVAQQREALFQEQMKAALMVQQQVHNEQIQRLTEMIRSQYAAQPMDNTFVSLLQSNIYASPNLQQGTSSLPHSPFSTPSFNPFRFASGVGNASGSHGGGGFAGVAGPVGGGSSSSHGVSS